MITIKKPKEIEILKEGGRISAEILDCLCRAVKPGINTCELEELSRKLIREAGGRPAQLDFPMPDGKKFPAALCASINSEIVHAPALPGKILREGDIVSLDFVMEYPIDAKKRLGRVFNNRSRLGGFYTDTARTVAVGVIDSKARALLKITEECLLIGIKRAKPGNYLSDIGAAIEKHAEAQGYGVVRELVGHGVGYSLHEDPQVPNYKCTDGDIGDAKLRPGMVLAIEPMISCGDWRIKQGEDEFAFVSADGSLSAHFEHSIVITEKGCDILTV
jgi:methionyl aminopeptidase